MVTNGNMINIVCIGTPRHNNDKLGPLVGTLLEIKGFSKRYPINIIGTMNDPVHGMNIYDKITTLPHAVHTIAVDAAVGEVVGNVYKRDKPVKPGSGMGKMLPAIGDVSFIAITCDEKSNFYSNVIPETMVYEMAEAVVQHIDDYLKAKCKKGVFTWVKQHLGSLLDATV